MMNTNPVRFSGKAVDLSVEGMTGKQLAQAIAPIWKGGIGIYSDRPRTIHLDVGPARRWGF